MYRLQPSEDGQRGSGGGQDTYHTSGFRYDNELLFPIYMQDEDWIVGNRRFMPMNGVAIPSASAPEPEPAPSPPSPGYVNVRTRELTRVDLHLEV